MAFPVLSPALRVIPPTSESRSKLVAAVPWSARIRIVSLVLPFAWSSIACAVLLVEITVNLPVVVGRKPPVPVDIVIPPAASVVVKLMAVAAAFPAVRATPPTSDKSCTLASPVPCSDLAWIVSLVPPLACKKIARAAFSVDVTLTLDPVAVMLMSSPADAPEARIFTPPRVDSMLIESVALSVDVKRIDEPVAVSTISSPAAAPDAKILTPPWVDSMLIESVALSVDVRRTDDPVAVMTMSSPADAPEAKISTPPAVDSISTASLALSPAVITTDPVAVVKDASPEDASVTSPVPSDVKVVKVPAPAVVPPMAGGAARTGARLEGVTNKASKPVEGVPAIASASVASSPIPAVVSVATGEPLIAMLSTYTFVATGSLLSVKSTVPYVVVVAGFAPAVVHVDPLKTYCVGGVVLLSK